jgi:5-methylcytosine-specific restriction endonuclease McrA
MGGDLPEPDSPELKALIRGGAARDIYRVLYESRGMPLTHHEIAERVGRIDQSQIQRRRRDLNPYFVIQRTVDGRDELVGMKAQLPAADRRISRALRAEVLQHGRCEMCGRHTSEGIRLQVDHKIPGSWGGTDEIENLQALCEDCNEGKKDRFAHYENRASEIASVIHYEEPHRRIGELLKAFDGEWVPTDLIRFVASAQQFQEDYQKRLRELRVLGWIIDNERRLEGGRHVSYYRVTHWEPWPETSIRAEIRRRERASKPGRTRG